MYPGLADANEAPIRSGDPGPAHLAAQDLGLLRGEFLIGEDALVVQLAQLLQPLDLIVGCPGRPVRLR